MREFKLGDPGVPDDGILVGRGGGVVEFYNDLTFSEDGSVFLLSYVTDGGPIPADHGAARLPWNGADSLSEWVQDLERLDFWKVPSPAPSPGTDSFDYLVLVRKPRIHFVEWSDPAKLPAGVYAASVRIWHWTAKQFLGSFGV